MIKTISRAPNDEFTYSLFTSLVQSISCEYEAYYLWSNPPQDLKSFLLNTKFSKPNVIIGIKDLLDLWEDYNFWQDQPVAGVALLDNIAAANPDKNFIIVTSLENIDLEFVTSTNIQFVQWGGDVLNQIDSYKTIEPVLNKNFGSFTPFISLNRHIRSHRLVALSYLFGNNYNQYGHITYLGQQIDIKNFDNLLDCIPWEFEPRHDSVRQSILDGYTKFYKNTDLSVDDYNIYGTVVNDNVNNFNHSLRTKYQHSFVEIVSESSFSSPSYLVTEKTLNSMYGCNFPIIMSGAGHVDHLRSIGFDMFDDIVNHSHDTIANPLDRIILAIENNKQLLTDHQYSKSLWSTSIDRFLNNIKISQKVMPEWYSNRAINQFNNIKWN